MKEVCIINYTSNAAVFGIGTYLQEYVYCLKKIGCKVYIVELGTDEKNPKFYVKDDGSVCTLHFPCLLKGDLNLYNKGVCRLLRLYIEDSDNLVFHYQYYLSESLSDNLKKYYPLSKSAFTIHYLSWSEKFQGNMALFEKIICNGKVEKTKTKYKHILDDFKKDKTFIEKVDRIICLSDDTFNLMREHYGVEDKIHLIPNGLRKDFRSMSKNQKTKLRERYYLRSEEQILLFVGRLDSGKGIELLIECFEDVMKTYPNYRLVLTGNGDINRMAGKCKNIWSKVIFTGRLDKRTLYNWYQIADIALFPSFHEQCSYVGIEMLMHGLPVVASDGFGVKNMFHEGINAKVANIGNRRKMSVFKKNLKNAIIELLSSDAEKVKIQKGASDVFHSKYSIEHMQKAYSDLLNSLFP